MVPFPPAILQPPPIGVLNKVGCIWLPNNQDPPKLDELLGVVEAFAVVSPKLLVGPPEGFAISEEDIASETPSSINLRKEKIWSDANHTIRKCNFTKLKHMTVGTLLFFQIKPDDI